MLDMVRSHLQILF